MVRDRRACTGEMLVCVVWTEGQNEGCCRKKKHTQPVLIFIPDVKRPLYQIDQSKIFIRIFASRNPVLPKRPSEEGAAALIRGRTGDATL